MADEADATRPVGEAPYPRADAAPRHVDELPGLTDLTVVGRGGFGIVYRGRQEDLGRWVAAKVSLSGIVDDHERRRFEREARATGMLGAHPNIVTVFGSGFTEDGRPYLLMEYLERGSLADRLAASGPLPAAEVAGIGVAVAGALHSAHHAGVLHRDIKPANILVDPFGRPKLSDFGIARIAGQSHSTTGSVTASLQHMAPELLSGVEQNAKADQYSLGSTLYTLLTGHTPYGDDLDVATLIARINGAGEPIPLPATVPAPVRAAVERAMRRDPAERFPSCADLSRALQESERTLGRPPTELLVMGDELGASVHAVTATPATKPVPREGPSRRPVYIAAAAVAVALIAGVFALNQSGKKDSGINASEVPGTTATGGPGTTAAFSGATRSLLGQAFVAGFGIEPQRATIDADKHKLAVEWKVTNLSGRDDSIDRLLGRTTLASPNTALVPADTTAHPALAAGASGVQLVTFTLPDGLSFDQGKIDITLDGPGSTSFFLDGVKPPAQTDFPPQFEREASGTATLGEVTFTVGSVSILPWACDPGSDPTALGFVAAAAGHHSVIVRGELAIGTIDTIQPPRQLISVLATKGTFTQASPPVAGTISARSPGLVALCFDITATDQTADSGELSLELQTVGTAPAITKSDPVTLDLSLSLVG